MEKPKVVGMITKILFKIHIYLKEKFDPQFPITKEEEFCLGICEHLINCPDSELTLSPITHKKLIKNPKKKIFVIIYNRQITLINNTYGYNHYVEDNEKYDKLIESFYNEVERRNDILENEMTENVKKSLEMLFEKVTNSPVKLS